MAEIMIGLSRHPGSKGKHFELQFVRSLPAVEVCVVLCDHVEMKGTDRAHRRAAAHRAPRLSSTPHLAPGVARRTWHLACPTPRTAHLACPAPRTSHLA